MKLIIVRHAEAEHNIQHLMVADGSSPLTEKGKAQVRRVADRLRDKYINVAFSSSSERALDTARGILEFHQAVRLEIHELLRERQMGNMEGKTREEFVADAKASGVKWYEHKPIGGESMLDTQQRAATFVDQLWPKYRGQTVLIVSHGGFIRALLAHIMKHDYDADKPIRLLNTAISIVELRDEEPHVAHVINNIDHLDKATLPIMR